MTLNGPSAPLSARTENEQLSCLIQLGCRDKKRERTLVVPRMLERVHAILILAALPDNLLLVPVLVDLVLPLAHDVQ